MSQLSEILQDTVRREREARTVLGLLRQQMDGGDRRRSRRSLKERLGLNGIGCCAATWGFSSTTMSEQEEEEQRNPSQTPNFPDPDCVTPTPASSGMNLAAALASERDFRSPQEPDVDDGTLPGTPPRVSLMRLLEETDCGDGDGREKEKEGGGGPGGNDTMCCVCMGRKKGAAFIPCGHTFCRVCSKELRLKRGSCPLCNRSIIEILDIF